MGSTKGSRAPALLVAWAAVGLLVVTAWGCSPHDYRESADEVAYQVIDQTRQAAFGRSEAFSIENPSETLRRRLFDVQDLPRSGPASIASADVPRIEQWPDPEYGSKDNRGESELPALGEPGTVTLSLSEALQIGARNSREYQSEKERVFEEALRLDLARDEYRGIWDAIADGQITRDLGVDPHVSGVTYGATAGVTRQLQNGTSFALNIGVDLVSLLTQDESSSLGVFGDASISVPLLRGSGRFVVTEPLKQAERDVVYAIYEFERFKRGFAVDVATDYLGVLRQLDQVQNAEENYRGLILSTRRARRLADAGRLPEIQVDQSLQDELSARNRWITAQQGYDRVLDRFKTLLGLPTDATIVLDQQELTRLEGVLVLTEAELQEGDVVPAADAEVQLHPPTDDDAGPLELTEAVALAIALESRLDLRTRIGRVLDSQRTVAVAADNLRADLTLLGSASAGSGRSLTSADLSNSGLRLDEGTYSALLTVDLGLERTAERNTYRSSLIAFEQAVRSVQALEDQIKLEVRDDLRTLVEARETLRIQAQAVKIAQRRVESTDLFLQAGRAEIRDLLEAQESLVSARNILTAARVQYRVSELNLQRDLDVLEVDEQGLWKEFRPEVRVP